MTHKINTNYEFHNTEIETSKMFECINNTIEKTASEINRLISTSANRYHDCIIIILLCMSVAGFEIYEALYKQGIFISPITAISLDLISRNANLPITGNIVRYAESLVCERQEINSIPRLPPEQIEEILNHVSSREQIRTLKDDMLTFALAHRVKYKIRRNYRIANSSLQKEINKSSHMLFKQFHKVQDISHLPTEKPSRGFQQWQYYYKNIRSSKIADIPPFYKTIQNLFNKKVASEIDEYRLHTAKLKPRKRAGSHKHLIKAKGYIYATSLFSTCHYNGRPARQFECRREASVKDLHLQLLLLMDRSLIARLTLNFDKDQESVIDDVVKNMSKGGSGPRFRPQCNNQLMVLGPESGDEPA